MTAGAIALFPIGIYIISLLIFRIREPNVAVALFIAWITLFGRLQMYCIKGFLKLFAKSLLIWKNQDSGEWNAKKSKIQSEANM